MKNKKIILTIIILISMLFILCGCENNNVNELNINNVIEDNNTIAKNEESNEENEKDKENKENKDDLYFKVLNNEIKYINESNKETLFSDYMKNYKEDELDVSVKYTIFDFDNDSENEMIVMIESYDGSYLILNNENGVVYGFEDVYRGMIMIKTDGTYNASGGANDNGVLRNKFEKNKRITETLAEMDSGKCKIAGKSVSNEEYIKYVDEFRAKEDVTFKTYIQKYEFSNNTANKSNSEVNSESTSQTRKTFNEGVYKMTKPSLIGTDAEGYDTTITLKGGKASFLESYWGRNKEGTYSVDDNLLTIKYTSGVEVDSINGDRDVTLNETEIYKIEENKITLQSSSNKEYKAGDTVYEIK